MLIENPERPETVSPPASDVLSDLLRKVRVSGSLQFCFMPTGAWQTDGKQMLSKLPGGVGNIVPFHIVAEGTCWLSIDGQLSMLAEGDVVAFPFQTGHQLGSGSDGRVIEPANDLPPKPWPRVPVLRYGEATERVRLLCGYLTCDAFSFRPLKDALPNLLHARTRESSAGDWLGAAVRQVIAEAEEPRTGGLSMLERLTEVILIELLRHQIVAAKPGSVGWLAALADPALARCLAAIHDEPGRDWSVQDLAAAAGLSRSTLANASRPSSTRRPCDTCASGASIWPASRWRRQARQSLWSHTMQDTAPRQPSIAPSRVPMASRRPPGGRTPGIARPMAGRRVDRSASRRHLCVEPLHFFSSRFCARLMRCSAKAAAVATKMPTPLST